MKKSSKPPRTEIIAKSLDKPPKMERAFLRPGLAFGEQPAPTGTA